MTKEQVAELILQYKAECRRVNGDEYADLLSVSYTRGWFYLRRPRKLPEGGYWVSSVAECVRAGWLVSVIAYMRAKPNFGGCRVPKNYKLSLPFYLDTSSYSIVYLPYTSLRIAAWLNISLAAKYLGEMFGLLGSVEPSPDLAALDHVLNVASDHLFQAVESVEGIAKSGEFDSMQINFVKAQD